MLICQQEIIFFRDNRLNIFDDQLRLYYNQLSAHHREK